MLRRGCVKLRKPQAIKSPLTKGGKAVGLGGCPGTFVDWRHDNPAVSAKPLSRIVKRDFDGALPLHTPG